MEQAACPRCDRIYGSMIAGKAETLMREHFRLAHPDMGTPEEYFDAAQ